MAELSKALDLLASHMIVQVQILLWGFGFQGVMSIDVCALIGGCFNGNPNKLDGPEKLILLVQLHKSPHNNTRVYLMDNQRMYHIQRQGLLLWSLA